MRKDLLVFIIIYFSGLIFLLCYRQYMGFPDYVIPGFEKMFNTIKVSIFEYIKATLQTFLLVIVGHLISVIAAFGLAIIVSTNRISGPYVKSAAYSLQAYPLIAVAPIFFILFGDGFTTQLLITFILCHFPVLLTILGVLMQPIPEVEQFYVTTKKMSKLRLVKIRLSENSKTVLTSITGSASLAVVGAILAEYLAEYSGIGYHIWVANNGNRLDGILLALFVIGVTNCVYLRVIEWCGFIILKQVIHNVEKVEV